LELHLVVLWLSLWLRLWWFRLIHLLNLSARITKVDSWLLLAHLYSSRIIIEVDNHLLLPHHLAPDILLIKKVSHGLAHIFDLIHHFFLILFELPFISTFFSPLSSLLLLIDHLIVVHWPFLGIGVVELR
jgi:hypothetical protein